MLPCTLYPSGSPLPSSQPIPPELLDAVLDHFASTPSALSSFSRVCRAWKHSCYRILFHTIRFKDGPDSDRVYTPDTPPARVLVSVDPRTGRPTLAPRFDDLLAFLDAAPDVCAHVQQLYLVGTCKPGAILSSSQSGLRLDVLQRVLVKLPKIQVLSLHFLHLLPAVPWSFLCTPTIEIPAFRFGSMPHKRMSDSGDGDGDEMDTDKTETLEADVDAESSGSMVYRMKLRRLHIGYLDSPPSDSSGVVHVLDVLDLFDEIQELDLDCMLIPERALRFALPAQSRETSTSSASSSTSNSSSRGPSLTRRLSPLRVSSLVFGEHCSPTVISLLVNVMVSLLQPDALTSVDVQLARNSSRFISDILPDLHGFLHCAVRNLRYFTCDISGGRYLKPDGEYTFSFPSAPYKGPMRNVHTRCLTSGTCAPPPYLSPSPADIAVNDELVRSALAFCSRLEVITLFLVIRADGASHAACKRGWNSCMNLLWSASGSSRVLSRINIAFLACDCDGDYCPEKSAFLENIGLLDWSRVDTFVDRCGSSLRRVTIKAVDGPYRKKGSFGPGDVAVGELGMEVLGVVRKRVSQRTQAVLRFL